MTLTVPLRRVFRVVNGGTPTSDTENWDGDVPWATPVDLARVDGGVLTRTDRTLTAQGLLTGSRTVSASSLIVSTRAPIGYVVQVDRATAFNQGCRGLELKTGGDIRFFRYQLSAAADRLAALGQGSTFVELASETLSTFRVSEPALDEQRAIADYLDRETARIDALIAAKQRMVNLLEVRFWAAFTQRVSDASARQTQMRRVLSSLIDGPFGSAFSSADYASEGPAVVRLGNIGFAEYRHADQAHVPLELFERFRAYQVVKGDLLIAGLGDDNNHAGRACVAPDLGDAMVKGKCFRGRVDPGRCSAEFLALLLSSPLGATAMGVSGRGSTRSMINLEVVKSTEVSIPSRETQEAIVDRTAVLRTSTEAAAAVIQQQLALLSERRQALINAAVTGNPAISLAA